MLKDNLLVIQRILDDGDENDSILVCSFGKRKKSFE
jgi:hypothetical protein